MTQIKFLLPFFIYKPDIYYTTTTSRKENITEQFTYPFDPEHNAETVYQKMVTLNMLNHRVTHTRQQADATQKIMTEHKEFATGRILPAKINTRTGTHTAEPRLQFHNCDSYGNPVYITRDNQETILYIWGYGGKYPVAECICHPIQIPATGRNNRSN